MSTTVIDRNEARAPFFGEKISFVTGLDPLGLQNPSIQAYSYLLPGLNNVTSRIRNYAFYCWLLQEYGKGINSSDPKNQKKFIRRAEYIIALVSVYHGIEGISGSNYAKNRISEGRLGYDLQTGTYNEDGSTENTYWQYDFGVFGQYYVGSLRQIGLIEQPVNQEGEAIGIYRRTTKIDNSNVSGQELAEAFDSNINSEIKARFLSCIEAGEIGDDDLKSLAKGFNLTEIKPDSKEKDLLVKLLLDNDKPGASSEDPVSMRKETLLHILTFIKKETKPFDQRLFTQYAYDQKGMFINKVDLCLTGWYYYQLNDFYQVASTAIFNGCLDHLQFKVGPGWMPVQDLIEDCKGEIVNFFKKEKWLKKENINIQSLIETNISNETEAYESIMKSNGAERMTFGFLLIFQLYQVNKENLESLRVFTSSRNIGDYDDVLTYFLNFERYLAMDLGTFISEFISTRILSRHQLIAYRKMGTGSQSTQKFIIEANYIRQIGNFGPGYTSPRISSLTLFLKDLGVLDNEMRLSIQGDNLLKSNSL